jgi:peptidoglycan/LPS O-acetylase OafA/YrhL
MPNTDILKSKRHFEVLDGLRGVAAIVVVTFHFMEMAISDYSKNFVGHGFLAVDFFFCLSGFVIGYAYDDRVGKMGAIEFFKSRLIRLHPLVVLGSVLGLFAFLFDPFTNIQHTYSAGKIALIFLTSILLIPFPVMRERGNNLFSFNAPSWSLFWEYIANIVYAVVLYRASRRVLLVMLIFSAIALGFVGHHSHWLAGGWGGESFWDGGARVAYSFTAGLMVYRSNWIIKNRLGFGGLTILLLAALLMPYFKWNWQMEALVILFYFPFLVALGAGAALTARSRSICILSGQLSYPLYMTHYTVIWMFMNYYNSHTPGTLKLTLIVSIGVLIMTGFAYVVMRLYDIPVRRYLSARRSAALRAAPKAVNYISV